MNALTEKKYRQLKDDVENAKSEAARARGAQDQLMQRLKGDFGCSTLKEAEAKLEELQKESASLEKKFNKALADYEEKWHES